MMWVKKFEEDSLHHKAVITVFAKFDVRFKTAVLYSDIFMCPSVSSYILDNTLYLIGYWINN